MKLEELIIDGFKSYATRTVISNWDDEFNCITGLNGSGKSNILDAICFVLGITSMNTVRAHNLQDLIYKRGQAGVTKASVTIVFDNRDTSKSPIGFERCPQISITRQIVMGGTSKYLINGHRAQQQAVQNLFQSIQLNINNPNFLIMQGRITKVLNMKPSEILAMIEEASGTRMFEERRDKAFKTMAKKDKKVEEINGLLREEIEPKLSKLRVEKRSFLELQQTQSDLERLTRVVVAHDFVRYSELANNFDQLMNQKKIKLDNMEADISKSKAELELIKEDLTRVRQLKENEIQGGKKYHKLEQELKDLSHEIVRINTLLDLKKSNLSEEEERGKALQKNISELEQNLQSNENELQSSKYEYEQQKDMYDSVLLNTNESSELLESLLTGVSAKEGQKNGFMDKIEDMRERVSRTITKQEQLKLQINHMEKRAEELQPKAQKAQKQNKSMFAKVESLEIECHQIEESLRLLKFEPRSHMAMVEQEKLGDAKVRELTAKIDTMKRRISNIDFTYSDPVSNFDRSKVKGLIAQLFSIEPDKYPAATALEICAGGRLYNVVVDTEITGSQLLEKGKLQKRVTIIPLNKISVFKASAEKISAAKKIAPGKVNLALSLVGYDVEVAKAMEYVFGNTLVCQDAETAKRVTFDPAVQMKSVTLEGDTYDPSGTLSGGSASRSSDALITIQDLNNLIAERNQEKEKLEHMRAIMIKEKDKIAQGTKLSQSLDLKKHETNLLKEQIANNSATSVINELSKLQEDIKNANAEIAVAYEEQLKAEQEVSKLQKDLSDFKKNKTSKLDELRAQVSSLKRKSDEQQQIMKTAQKKYQSVKMDKEQIDSDIIAARQSLEDAKLAWNQLNDEISVLLNTQEESKKRHQEISEVFEKEKAKLMGLDEELLQLEKVEKERSQVIEDLDLKKQKATHELDNLKTEASKVHGRLNDLLNQYSWISEEKDSFGRSGTPYDYSGYNIEESKKSMKKLSERFNEMKKTVNAKVMNMIDNVEKKDKSLRGMLRTIEKDKLKIEETIVTLDQYKKEALIKTWHKVNVDFGQIFADMLPGSFAKLEPSNEKDVSEGLEVKVCLGKIWKESLTELSGGQRSLVALSLIMALLQFKPAPMYILDEVDAALDLSHTQNIGRLIKTRFKGSQFIVVSLKEGFFSNANRVFRARFQEGTSVVSVM
ncbi:P-loop containing nucleoside triphosphate hydrolase protein [Dipodascopsis uninucleata]